MLKPMDSQLHIHDWLETRTALILNAPYTQDERAISAENISALCAKPSSNAALEIRVRRADRQSGIPREPPGAPGWHKYIDGV
jgi:hypothetical protein